MSSNTFADDPLKVFIYDPRNNNILQTKVFVNAPKAIQNAIKSRDARLLKSHFGADYKKKLCLLPLSEYLPVTGEALGGSFTGGDYGVDMSDIEALLAAETNDKSDAPRDDYVVTKKEMEKMRQKELLKQTLNKSETTDIAPDMITDSTDDFTATKSTIEYVYDTHVFPEDKFSDLRNKIYLTCGIPPYRQHIFYVDKMRINGIYKLYAGGLYPIDIRNVSASTDNILGLPIDKFIYDSRDEVRVESLDDFELIGGALLDRNVYVVDLALFCNRIMTQLNELINDTYRVELLYYGFILKFWPILTQECFNDYIINERELEHKYPDLAPTRSMLLQRYTTEKDIIDYNYTNMNKALSSVESIGITFAIVQMTAMVDSPRTSINIRNLFDKLRVTRCIPEIHAYVESNGKKYLLRKRHIKNASDIPFPSGALLKTGITIAISILKGDQESFHARSSLSTIENEQSRYIFLNIQPNGRYYIKTIWNEEDELGFDTVLKILKKFTNPILGGINALGKYVFIEGKQIPLLSKTNVYYHSLNTCIFWKKVMLENAFKIVKTLFEPYLRAGITAPRNVQQFDKYEFTFCKGMYDFNRELISNIISASHNIILSNYYAHLSNNSIKQKWNQNYEGRVVRMSHRTTDVRFEILGVREHEFTIFYRYIVLFIYRAQNDPKVISALNTSRNYKDVKRLRKLREQDPELYNVKKYGSEKTYSVLCQKSRQPLIYTADEIKEMSQADIKKLTLYWNFTLNKPQYYGCPNRKNPHLTFITNIHPKQYCLPCCGKTSSHVDSKKARMSAICLSKHRYITGETFESGPNRHIKSYGKDIDHGRLSKIPTSAKELLFNTLKDSKIDYYIYGVNQHFPAVSNIGIIYAAAETLDLAPSALITNLIAGVKPRKDLIFSTILNGTLIEYFHSSDDFILTIKELFIENKMFSHEFSRFTYWAEVFLELFYLVLDLCIFVLVDDNGTGENIDIFIPDIIISDIQNKSRMDAAGIKYDDKSTYLLMVKKINKYYPVFILDNDKYFKYAEIYKKKFTRGDNTIDLIYQMIHQFYASNALTINKKHNLLLLQEFAHTRGYKIILKYVNKQNLCYAILLETKGGIIYFPVDYSIYTSDGVPISFSAFGVDNEFTVGLNITIAYATINGIVNEFNKYILENYKLTTDSEFTIYAQLQIGRIITCGTGGTPAIAIEYNNLYFYLNYKDGISVEAAKAAFEGAKTRAIDYDPRSINNAILNREAPAEDNSSLLLGQSLYSNYKYQLLVLEFMEYLESERNKEIRTEILKLITVTNFKKDMATFIRNMKTLLKEFPNDFILLQKQLSKYYYEHNNKTILLEDIENTIYEFDKLTLNRLRKLPTGEVKAQLIELCKKFTVEKDFDTSKIKFPNIYLPCATGNNFNYCDNNKLILNTSLSDYVDILASDIKDDLKVRYLMSGVFTDTTLSYLTFSQAPTETITIYRLEE
jgi:hypothetical protein